MNVLKKIAGIPLGREGIRGRGIADRGWTVCALLMGVVVVGVVAEMGPH